MNTQLSKQLQFRSPFQLTSSDLKEFQALYLQEFGISISEQKAKTLANQLLLAVKAVFKPIPKSYVK